jgi:transposase
MGARYKNVDRDTPMLLPCDLREWVGADDLVHFVVEALQGVELPDKAAKRGSGSEEYPPLMMLALLIYCYATGVFSSRKIERFTYESVSVRYLCANTHPDHDTIATFRRSHRQLFAQSFTSVLQLARQLKLVHLGTVHLDGTKILANASKRATVDEAAVEQQLELADRALCEGLLARAEAADRHEADEAFRLPQELASVAQRKAKLEAAREALKAKAAAKAQASAKKPAAKTATAKAKPRVNLTDPDSGLMPQRQGGFVQGYNAQLAVEAHGVIVGQTVTTATNDRAELQATAATILAARGEIMHLVADEGYDHQKQIAQVETLLDTNVVCPPQASTRAPAARRTRARAELATQRLQRARFAHSPAGRELLHLRQTTIEPVFGGIKHNLRFQRFHLRGLERVRTEWTLLTTAYNCRQLWRRKLERN